MIRFPIAIALGTTLGLAPAVSPLGAQDAPERARAAAPSPSPSTPATSRWQLALENGTFVWDVRLSALAGDTLHVTRADGPVAVPVGQITEIRLIRKSELQMGAATPGGMGATGGALSALVGGDDEVYDLAPLDFAERLRAVQQLVLRHPPE